MQLYAKIEKRLRERRNGRKDSTINELDVGVSEAKEVSARQCQNNRPKEKLFWKRKYTASL